MVRITPSPYREHKIHVRCGCVADPTTNETTAERGTNAKIVIAAASPCNVCSAVAPKCRVEIQLRCITGTWTETREGRDGYQ